jgi:hypothetical protein
METFSFVCAKNLVECAHFRWRVIGLLRDTQNRGQLERAYRDDTIRYKNISC